MKGKPDRRRVRLDRAGAEALAGQALGVLADDPERLGRFLATTGLDPANLRAAAAEPGFLPAVLDHLASDERLLVDIAGEIGVSPADLDAARALLSPEPDWET